MFIIMYYMLKNEDKNFSADVNFSGFLLKIHIFWCIIHMWGYR